MDPSVDIDSTLRVLGGRGRYQLMQMTVICLGSLGSALQLLDNIFIGERVSDYNCSTPANITEFPSQIQGVDWNSSNIKYGQCHIAVAFSNRSEDVVSYGCVFGYIYHFPREKSFRSQFDLVCGRALLGGLSQTFVILGQGIGALLSSMISDRFGRKRVLTGSQLGLLVVGLAIGFAPSFPVFAFLKFVVGCFQQGVVTSTHTLTVEILPTEHRTISILFTATAWFLGAVLLTPFAFLLRGYPWRYLQYAVSCVSLVAFLQMWYLDESIRWLAANGKTKELLSVLRRAARTNCKNYDTVLQTVKNNAISAQIQSGMTGDKSHDLLQPTTQQTSGEKLTLFDIFRHKQLLINALVLWFSWFTCALAFFALYLMSTTLHGNRFLNYFLTSLMEFPSTFVLYWLSSRYGRKAATEILYLIAGFGLLSSGICRIFTDNVIIATLSIITAMLGMLGSSGMFAAIFFLTPELFPTNLRNQALGASSLAGRMGGMLSPFMAYLVEIVVWGPGAIISILCFTVAILFRLLPESKGRQLPHTVADIKMWSKSKVEKSVGEVDKDSSAPMVQN